MLMKTYEKLSGVNKADIANWERYGFIKAPPAIHGTERIFGTAQRPILLKMAFAKAQIRVGIRAGDAFDRANVWFAAQKDGRLGQYWVCPSDDTHRARETSEHSETIRDILDHPAQADAPDDEWTEQPSEDLSCTAVRVIDLGEIVRRIDTALKKGGE